MQEMEEESALSVWQSGTVPHERMNESALTFDNPAIQESFVSPFNLLPHEIESRILLFCSFCRRSGSLNTQELQYFLFTDRWLSQTKNTETKDRIQRLHSPLGLIRSSSPQSEAINTALIKSSSENTQQKSKHIGDQKTGREQKLKAAIRMKWVDASITHHDDRTVDKTPSDATAETPWCCCYWKSTKSILEASAKPNPNPNQWGTVSEP